MDSMGKNTKTVPFNIGRVISLPGKTSIGFYIVLSPRAISAVGILEQITKIFAKRGIPILNLKVSTLEKSASIIVFADLTNMVARISVLEDELRKVRFVKEVRIIKPIINGILVDIFSFPILLNEERVIIFRRTIYEPFIKTLSEKLGAGYAAILYHIGFEIGCRSFKDAAKNIPGDLKKRFIFSAEMGKHAGLGIFKLEKIDPIGGYVTFRVYESFECELFKGSNKPSGHFIRGIIAGWFAAVKGVEITEIEVEEIKCIAKGDDYCEFIARVVGK